MFKTRGTMPNPTPSQPKNKLTKLSPVTKTIIKKVNNDKHGWP